MKNILDFFEKNKIFYDLDSENILYKDTKKINLYLDIDLYWFFSKYCYKKPKLIKSTDNIYNYKAPELYNDIKIKNLSKGNIWALGVLIFQMIFHEFPNKHYQKKLNKDNLLHNLISKMLSIPPEKRLSLNELINAPFIKQVNNLYDNSIKHDIIIRILFIGQSAVGNNSLANSFISNIPYLGNYAIIGINIENKLIYYKGLKIKLVVMNGSGQERFFSIIKVYFKKTDIFILTFDIHDSASLKELEKRYNLMKENIGNKIFAVCANKIDLKDENLCDEEKIKEFMTKNKFEYYFRTSCKTYEGIEDMFYNLIDIYFKKNKDTIKIEDKEKLKKKENKKDCNII